MHLVVSAVLLVGRLQREAPCLIANSVLVEGVVVPELVGVCAHA